MSIHVFNDAAIDRIANAVRTVEDMQGDPAGGVHEGYRPPAPIYAIVTAETGDGVYSAKEVRPHTGGAQDYEPTPVSDSLMDRITTIRELNGTEGLTIGTVVEVKSTLVASGSVSYEAPQDFEWVFTSVASYGVEQDGAWVEITAKSSGLYSWKQLDTDASTDTVPAVIGGFNAKEVNNDKELPVGIIVWLRSGPTYYHFSHPRDLFPVDVTKTSGVAGDATTQCAFVYTVNHLNGEQLLTSASPVWNRPQYGKLVAATSGTAYVNSSGVVTLYQVDEVPAVTECS